MILLAPPSISGGVIANMPSGATYAINANGQVTVTAQADIGRLIDIGFVPIATLVSTQFNSISAAGFTAAQMAGAAFVDLQTSGATAVTTPTATQILAALPVVSLGLSYILRIYNTNGGTLTLTGGTGVTITGTATIATNVWREYLVTVTGISTPTVTLQNRGAGNAT